MRVRYLRRFSLRDVFFFKFNVSCRILFYVFLFVFFYFFQWNQKLLILKIDNVRNVWTCFFKIKLF